MADVTLSGRDPALEGVWLRAITAATFGLSALLCYDTDTVHTHKSQNLRSQATRINSYD